MVRKVLAGLWATCALVVLQTGVANADAADIVLFASDASNLHGNWARVPDSTAAGGQMMSSADLGWSSTTAPQTTPADYFDFTFSAPANTPYHIWVRLRAGANSKWNDSLFVQLSDARDANGAAVFALGSTSALTVNLASDAAAQSLSGWGWEDGAYWLAQGTTVTFAAAGTHTLRIQTREDGFQLDQVVLSPSTYLAIAPGVSSNDATIVPKPIIGSTPYTGSAIPLPGAVRAENFDHGGEGVAYHDASPANAGGDYRSTDVDIQASNPAGYNIGWTADGEWLAYTVNVATSGLYLLQFQVASPGATGRMHARFGSADTAAIPIPNTGGWQNWTTVGVPVNLTAGQQLMKVFFDVGGFNLAGMTATFVPPPSVPVAQTPANGATGVATAATLGWNAPGATSFDVRFGTTNPPAGVATGLAAASYIPAALANGTTYFWQVIARNDGGTTTGPVSSFTTIVAPPATPVVQSPANGATGIATSATLSWSAAGATSYDVLLGPTNPPGSAATGLSTASYAPSGLTNSTTYSWQIVARNDGGTTAGPVLTFTTVGPQPNGDIVIYASDIPAAGRHGSWTAAADASSPNAIKLVTSDNGVASLNNPLASPVDYVDVTFDAPAGTPYRIWMRLQALANSKYNDAVWLQFSDARAGGTPVYPIGTTAGLLVNLATDAGATSLNKWGWQNTAYWLTQPTTVSFAANGTHTVRVQIREDGVQFDQIVLSPDTYLNAAPGALTNDNTIVSAAGTPQPPSAPGLPNPAFNATGVSITPTLTWSASGATTYEVRLGTTNPPAGIDTGQVNATYSPAQLANGATYFWQIVARNAGGTTAGPVWSFTTAPAGGHSTIWNVPAGGDLQAAINNAQPGDTILLQAGATFTGNFLLPAKAGNAFITIRSSAADALLPGPGTRIHPTNAPLLPKIKSVTTEPALRTLPGAHHYRLMLVEFPATYQGFYSIIRLGDGSPVQNTLSTVPYELVLDRVYIHGDPVYGQKNAIALNSAATSIINSYISEIRAIGQDSQAIGGTNGPGPFTIVNNYLEAAGENIMFGGGDPAIPNLVPSDIIIRGNHLYKPMAWRSQPQWTVKNLFELKNAQRVLVDGNVMENNWQGGQSGYAVVFTPRNQDGACPWCVVQDVQFTNNIVRNVAGGFNILGRDNNYPSLETSRIVVRNNLFENVSGAQFGGQGRFLLMTGGGRDYTFDHNTVLQDGWSVIYVGNPVQNFVFTNNIVPDYSWAIMGDGQAPGNATITNFFPYSLFAGNIFAGSNASKYPGGNHYPTSLAAAGFVNYMPLAGGNYRLALTSLYRNAGNDGNNVGVDIDAMNLAAGTSYRFPSGTASSSIRPATVVAPRLLARRIGHSGTLPPHFMAISIQSYGPQHERAVQAFNGRLTASGQDENLVFYSESIPRWLPKLENGEVYNEYFIAVEDDVVRGAYALKWQKLLFPDGAVRSIACYHHPLSEGIINKAYAGVGALLIRDAIGRSPLLYCLGMGGYERPLPRMLIGMRWSHVLIPFHFRVVRPFRFLREMQALRDSRWRRTLMDLGAFSGAGWLASTAWRQFARLRSPRVDGVAAQPVTEFSDWADGLWRDAKQEYSLTAVRDCRTLQTLYPSDHANLLRLRVTQHGRDVGWAVVGERRRDAKYGAMRVGSIVDCWAKPGDESSVIRAAAAALEERQVDLIVTNQSHPRWSRAVERDGFIAAPSNFVFAASRQMSELLAPFEINKERMHLTRADGDGLPDNF